MMALVRQTTFPKDNFPDSYHALRRVSHEVRDSEKPRVIRALKLTPPFGLRRGLDDRADCRQERCCVDRRVEP